MKTLIIHPKDSTTDFLKPIYLPIRNKTIVTGGVDKSGLKEMINNHERVIMLGHGTQWGLMAVGQFPDAGFLIIDDSFSEILSAKKNNIYIWCNADQYVYRNRLTGFCCGMFISEPGEAMMYDLCDWEIEIIEESNNRFAEVVGDFINEPIEVLYRNVLREYGVIARNNIIAKFNLDRFYYRRTCVGINRSSFSIS